MKHQTRKNLFTFNSNMSSVTTREYCEPCMFVKLESVKADMFCEDCRERYCECCALDHAKFRVFRNHKIVDVPSDYENMKIGPTVNVISVASSKESMSQQDVNASNKVERADNKTVDYERNHMKETAINERNYINVDYEETQKDPSYEQQPQGTDNDNTSFDVKVVETDLARRIPDIRRTDLSGTLFNFTVGRTGLSLALGDKEVFQAGYATVRRFGWKNDHASIEYGRACTLGAGKLKLVSAEVKDICSAIDTQTHSKGQ